MARNKYAVARRSIWYILRLLLVLVLALAALLGIFTTGLYTSNIYIILQDGMAKRAACILEDGDFADLTEYFTDDFLLSDEALTRKAYADFTVSAYDYRIEAQRLLALPWESTVTVRALEKLAGISAAPSDRSENALAPTLPEWPTTLDEIEFVKKDNRWYINKITVIELDPKESPLPTPDMSLAPVS